MNVRDIFQGINFSPARAEEAWYRILLSLLFGWMFFVAGLLLELSNIFFFSTLFFIFVGILLYLFVDAILFLVVHGDEHVENHAFVVVGSVFGFLLNLTILYGAYLLFSF